MPFQLTNATAAFMNLINRVFYHALDQYVIVFIDDILLYLKSSKEHADHLTYVMITLREHHLYAKLSKFSFWLNQISFLGHEI